MVGIDGPRGPMPVAFVLSKNADGTIDEAALIAHCKQKIAHYKVPHHVLAIDVFPFTPSANGNKIQKSKLRDIALAVLRG